MNVNNRHCIRNLSRRSMGAARSRNLIAIAAIALTTLLFTSLFTIALSINDAFQMSNFRQVGGYNHGTIKYLTEQQYNELRADPLIKEYGLRRVVGMVAEQPPFNKSHVEVGYSDSNQAHWMFCDPVEGALPQEGTREAATDLRVLELLGVTPELGAEFTLTMDVDGIETTETFVLSGWWEYDTVSLANHVLVPQSRANEIFTKLGTEGKDGMTTRYNLDIMLGSDMNIESNIEKILANYGYQSSSRAEGDNYISIGINWGYTGAQLSDSMDFGTILGIVGILLVITFTGYLIIYNVFQISVTNDIRFYGLLKTIGTTGRQLRRLIRMQALILSLVGIPLGLLLGYGAGVLLVPVVLAQLNVVQGVVSANPIIFAGSALFALMTVLLSCRKPGRMAARVSPVEAVRYTEGGTKQSRKGTRAAGHKRKGVSLPSMAWANIGRSRNKTAVTIVSLSLSVVLLNMTFTFTGGFDMDKYLSYFVSSDFVFADAGYFNVGGEAFSPTQAIPSEELDKLEAMPSVTGGRIYGKTTPVNEYVTEERMREIYGRFNDSETVNKVLERTEQTEDGLYAEAAQLYGMEQNALDRLELFEGDLSKLSEPGGRYVAAVYNTDDYGNLNPGSHWAKLGEKITLRFVDEYEYFHPDTGVVYPSEADLTNLTWHSRAKSFVEREYEVVALVGVPTSLTYRYYGSDEYVMNDKTFIEDTGSSSVMLYPFDVDDSAVDSMEQYLAEHTTGEGSQYNYESRAIREKEFEGFRSMFAITGGLLSFIIGMVGVLNFLNSILTGILTRKREFAMLQSIGMTGRQLQKMLVCEGLYYALGSVVISLVLCVASAPMLTSVLGSMFWFFTARFTIVPIVAVAPLFVLLGVLLPLAVYHSVSRRSIVERLREAE